MKRSGQTFGICRTCLCYLCCCSLFQAFLHDRTAHAVPYRSWRRPSRKPPVGEPLCEQPRCLERQSGRLSTSRKSVIVQIAFPFHPASRPQYFRMTRNFRYARLWKPSLVPRCQARPLQSRFQICRKKKNLGAAGCGQPCSFVPQDFFNICPSWRRSCEHWQLPS